MLKPGQVLPDLQIELINGQAWTPATMQGDLAILAISRGLFCRYCHEVLTELERLAADFAAIGVEVVTTSTDCLEEAQKTAKQLELNSISVGYGLAVEDIRRLGLFATKRQGAMFSEPAILIVRSDVTVYAVLQHSIGCGQVDVPHLLEGLQLLAPAGFPPRGNA